MTCRWWNVSPPLRPVGHTVLMSLVHNLQSVPKGPQRRRPCAARSRTTKGHISAHAQTRCPLCVQAGPRCPLPQQPSSGGIWSERCVPRATGSRTCAVRVRTEWREQVDENGAEPLAEIRWTRGGTTAAPVWKSHHQDSLAEWSKALASGASPQGRGFEPHSCQFSIVHCAYVIRELVLRMAQKCPYLLSLPKYTRRAIPQE